MNVSPDFSPSIKLMKPYFILAIFFYVLSFVALYFLNPQADYLDFSIVAWVHLYMLGFVMMSIFAAMAQLGPVVVETQHIYDKVFRYVWVFLTLGLILMMLGFYVSVEFLTYGGILVLIAMSIYAFEFLLTLKNMKRKTSITNAMKMSNFFLLFGILTGLLMALGFNNYISINPHDFLKIHTYSLVLGFVVLLIMGISIILIPMFGYSKRISDNNFSKSFLALSAGVIIISISPLFLTSYLENLAYTLSALAILLYFYQLKNMLISRKRVVHDIWARSMYVGYLSFIAASILIGIYFLNQNILILKLAMWLMLIGFFGFLIIGNFYKIIPFLVWFQVYSPLIETQSVPMLHELVPLKESQLQWVFSSLGLLSSSLGLSLQNDELFFAGVTFLLAGALIFFLVIIKILKVKI